MIGENLNTGGIFDIKKLLIIVNFKYNSNITAMFLTVLFFYKYIRKYSRVKRSDKRVYFRIIQSLYVCMWVRGRDRENRRNKIGHMLINVEAGWYVRSSCAILSNFIYVSKFL